MVFGNNTASNILGNFEILRVGIITKCHVQPMLANLYMLYPSIDDRADSQMSLQSKLRLETFKQWSGFFSSDTPHRGVLLSIFVGFCTV